MSKSIFKSKTFYFALLYILVGAAGLFGFADYQPSADVVQIGALVTGVITLILRLVTNQGVSL